MTMRRCLILVLLITQIMTAVFEDKMDKVPGYGPEFNTSAYSGYLDVGSSQRQLHYVFLQSVSGVNNSDPVTLWLNGGPGCSSMLGFIQEIGPYYLEDGKDYHIGDILIKNNHSWHKVSNLLFLQSPAGVGYSYNLNTKFQYSDFQTALDNFNAILDFFKKYPQYQRNGFWIAGQSYAGKYIPDLFVLIDQYNKQTKSVPINMKGFLIGNGVMSFVGGSLQVSQINFMVDRSFIDPSIRQYWQNSCQFDEHSAGCKFFKLKYIENTMQINPYNVYSYCFYNDSFNGTLTGRSYRTQQTILMDLARNANKAEGQKTKYNGAPCAYFDGIYDYFHLHGKQYHAKYPNMQWNGPCAQNITYHVDLQGSIPQYRYIMGLPSSKYSLNLYNGNWDDVVPYQDTFKHMRETLGLRQSAPSSPWFTNDQHSGFNYLFEGIHFTTFKGASHQVPQSKRAQSLQYFTLTLDGHKESFDEKKSQKVEIVQE